MESKAIEKIQELSLAATKLATFQPTAMLPSSMKVEDLEPFQEYRSRFRGTMETLSISDFVGYTRNRKADAESASACFVDSDTMSATAFFNMGTCECPGHCDDIAVLSLRPTAEFDAVTGIDGSRLKQKNLAEWLDDYREHLGAISSEGGADMPLSEAIAAVRSVSVESSRTSDHDDRDFGASRSTLEQLDAKARGGRPLPRAFSFTCYPYEGLSPRDIYLRLSFIAGDEPAFTLRIIRRETLENEIAEEFRELIVDKFHTDNLPTYIGTFTP